MKSVVSFSMQYVCRRCRSSSRIWSSSRWRRRSAVPATIPCRPAFASALGRLPHVELRALDEGRALQAVTLAAEHGLRGADAVYASVAIEAGCTLVSLDGEHLTRLPAVMGVLTPAAALATLTASPNA